MNSKSTVQLTAQDVDGDSLTFFITSVPAVGTLSLSSGTVVRTASPSSPVAVGNTFVYFQPAFGQIGSPYASFNFYASDGSANTGIQTVSLSVLSSGHPVARDINVTIAQNTNTTISFTATDPNGISISSYSLFSFTFLGGSFYTPAGAAITASTYSTTTSSVKFAPAPGTYSTGDAPYATFAYTATNAARSVSNQGKVSVYVYRTVFPAPVYTGATNFTTMENTPVQIILAGSSDSGDYSFLIPATAKGAGSLYSGNTLLTFPATVSASAVLTYVPPSSTSGVKVGFFDVIVVDAHGQSAPVQVTVDVTKAPHIDVPPTVVPVSYTASGKSVFNWNSIVMAQDTQVLIVFNVTDPDTDSNNITLRVSSLPYRGTLSQYQGQAFTLTSSSLIPAGNDGLYRVVFTPAAGESGTVYTTFNVKAFDGQFESQTFTASIRVKHLNIAPTVTLAKQNYTTALNKELAIKGITIGDADAGAQPINVVLKLATVSGTIIAFDVPSVDNSVCKVTVNSLVTIKHFILIQFINS